MTLRKCVVPHTPLLALWVVAILNNLAPLAARADTSGLFDPSEEAHPGALLEVMYARAEIFMGKGKLVEAVQMLDRILLRSARDVPALQLKLSALRSLNDLQGLADTYQALMWVPSEHERLPQYSFEAALIYRQLGKQETARTLFTQALQGGYSESTCHFFLGQIALENDEPVEAQEHFEDALSTQKNTPQIEVASLFQLGAANLRDFHAYFGNAMIHDALLEAKQYPKDPGIAAIAKTAEATLQPLDHSQWFGSLSAMGRYDSNVAQVPTTNNASGVAVSQLALNGGVGHIGSPLASFQWLESLRFFGNLNFPSQNTAAFEYETVAPSLYLTHAPLSRTPWGLKAEADLTAQGQDGGGYRFPFLIAGDLGAFVKWRTIPRDELELSGGIKPQDYGFADSAPFSGLAEYARLSWRREGSNPLWNPSISVNAESDTANDTSNSYVLVGGTLSDGMKFREADWISIATDLGVSSYSAAGRLDKTVTVRANGSRQLTSHIALIADVSLTSDISSLPGVYSYTRAVLGAGLSYAL